MVNHQVVDEYLSKNDVRIAIVENLHQPWIFETTTAIKEIYHRSRRQAKVLSQYETEQDETKIDSDIWDAIHRIHKLVYIGSDIKNHGLFSPLQMHLAGDKIFNPHPGSDKIAVMMAMNCKNIPIMWDVKDYWLPYMPDLDYEYIKSSDQLKKYFLDWNCSKELIGDYRLSGYADQFFAKISVKRANDLLSQKLIDLNNTLYQRFEINGSKSIRTHLFNTKEKFSQEIEFGVNTICCGPLVIKSDGSTNWINDKVWKT
jgi:hypothetical protein